MADTPTYLAGELEGPLHHHMHGTQLWTIRLAFSVPPELFKPVVQLQDYQVWAVPNSIWSEVYAEQTRTVSTPFIGRLTPSLMSG